MISLDAGYLDGVLQAGWRAMLLAALCQPLGCSSASPEEVDAALDGAAPDVGGDDAADDGGLDVDVGTLADAAADGGEVALLPYGAACGSGAECQSGTCFGGHRWPGGYCGAPCRNDADCLPSTGAVCRVASFSPGWCLATCATSDDCRPGYFCQGWNETGTCSPDLALVGQSNHPLDIQCASQSDRRSFNFTVAVPEGVGALSITVIARDLYPVLSLGLDGPAGLVPATTRPQGQYQVPTWIFGSGDGDAAPLPTGAYSVGFQSAAAEQCISVAHRAAPAVAIDLNLVFVGTTLDATSAPDDPALSNALAYFDEIFQQLGVSLRTVRHRDLDPALASELTTIDDLDELQQLNLTSALTRPLARDEVMAVNVFWVTELGDGIFGMTVSGFSAAIPGPPGLHGSQVSGVALEERWLRGSSGGRSVGRTLAHEVGHFLGLGHLCDDRDPACPDWGNLMVPSSPPEAIAITARQRTQLLANPLLRP